ncbi:intracellular transport uso1 [Fusarium albosuccineum]|uniref:Intracellular transport uso1 n=1 Tax=Fusarium albosuccineum TaxID=1237068 RepID=A0A8H4LIX4_9HYPO|nr:intracellular transport uso1 [Fusarium albosuccineum]
MSEELLRYIKSTYWQKTSSMKFLLAVQDHLGLHTLQRQYFEFLFFLFLSLNKVRYHLFKEHKMTYQGVVRVTIDALLFAPDYSSRNHNVDTAKVARLKQIFEQEGCNRYDPQNFITGIIDQDVFQKALVRSRLTSESLQGVGEPPMLFLPPNTYVRCDQGKSRVKALAKTRGLFHWWTLKLFTGESTILVPKTGIDNARKDQEALNKMIEGPMNEGHFSDGRIYAEIVQNCPDPTVNNEWWARLSKSKAEILKRLLDHRSLAAPLLELTHLIPAMREGLWIGEINQYFKFILETWIEIMGSRSALRHIDPEAVRELQLRAPGVSQRDLEHVTRIITNELAFKSLTDMSERTKLLSRLKRINLLIPSIYTLQKDVKYLQPCAGVMKQLIQGRERFCCTVQTAARTAFSLRNFPGADSMFLDGFKRLYLFIMQNWVQLTGKNPHLENRESNPRESISDPRAWFRLASEAQRLGFRSAEITRLASTDPDRELALKALLLGRPEPEYEYDESDLDNAITSVVQAFRTARRRQPVTFEPRFTTRGVGEPLSRRCGPQYSEAYGRDRQFLTMSHFALPVQRDMDVTSLFVRKSVFHAFFRIEEQNETAPDASSFPPVPPMAPSSGGIWSSQECGLDDSEDEGMNELSPSELLGRQDEVLQQDILRQHARDVAASRCRGSGQIVDISSDSCESASESECSIFVIKPKQKKRRTE